MIGPDPPPAVSPLLPSILRSTHADGADLRDSHPLSANPEAASLIKTGEQAFLRHDLDEAFRCYKAAYDRDPQSYAAALFCGDVFFNQERLDEALSWFRKAIAINPDAEMAHRYSGDAYMKLGDTARARAAYIDAVIADPYNRIPREMLNRVARSQNLVVRKPDVAIPRVPITVEAGKTKIRYNPATGPLVLAYTIGRAHWLDVERGRYFPADSQPRHSVEEECAGLRMFVATAEENHDSKETMEKFGPTVRTLKALDAAGLLAAYVLLDRADEGIAEDYEAYRRVNRPLLLRYINEVWLGTPAGVAAAKP
jgi:tetratricopeptide (TPR) repeat protein